MSTRVDQALASMAHVTGPHNRRDTVSQARELRAIYRGAVEPGSIAYIEAPETYDDAAVVLMVAGPGRLLRVPLGRNRVANLIQELLKVLV